MTLNDPQKAALVALWSAKTTFATLALLREFFGNDLDLGKVAFTLALRTRPDFFVEPPEKFAEIVGGNEFFISNNLAATIYEISKYSNIDRSTVRRKLNKLVELGFAKKTEDNQWSLINFLEDDTGPGASTLLTLFKSYVTQIDDLLRIISPSEIHTMLTTLGDLQDVKFNALTTENVKQKIQGLK